MRKQMLGIGEGEPKPRDDQKVWPKQSLSYIPEITIYYSIKNPVILQSGQNSSEAKEEGWGVTSLYS